jgi:hypothetical protein
MVKETERPIARNVIYFVLKYIVYQILHVLFTISYLSSGHGVLELNLIIWMKRK